VTLESNFEIGILVVSTIKLLTKFSGFHGNHILTSDTKWHHQAMSVCTYVIMYMLYTYTVLIKKSFHTLLKVESAAQSQPPYFYRDFTVLQVNHLPYSRVIKARMNCWTCIRLLLGFFVLPVSLLFLAFFSSQFILLLVAPF